jgi:haloacid dehalogenase superfamily, subfamily IA, variant 1 with third motif having Dx(3-4)D or Dx(3-4)E
MKAVLFDFGGTIDTNGIHWSEKFWDVYQMHSVPVSKQDYEKAYIFAENNITGQIKQGFGFKDTLEMQIKLQIEYLQKMKILNGNLSKNIIEELTNSCYYSVTETISNIKNYIETLSNGYTLGVVSNFYGNLETVLKEFSLYKYFSSIVDSEIVGLKKPDPQIYIHSLTELKSSPCETWMVGDSYERDIQPAKKAGCKTIWLDVKSWKRPTDTRDADFIIKSLTELINIIN